jgi:hypothetical protein
MRRDHETAGKDFHPIWATRQSKETTMNRRTDDALSIDDVLSKENAEKTRADERIAGAVATENAAKGDRARIDDYIRVLREGQASSTAVNNAAKKADDRIKLAQSKSTAFQASADFQAAVAAAGSLPGGLTEADMKAVVCADLACPPEADKKKYADYVAALETAKDAEEAGLARVAQAKIDVQKAKLDLDAAGPKVAPVNDAAGRVEGWLGSATKPAAPKPTEPAQMWWAVYKTKKLLAKID